MIPPTVGRVVLFYRDVKAKPLAAMISEVHGNRCVNLGIFMPNGVPMSHPPTSVTLIQDDDTVPVSGSYCTWMPYQLGQAAKTEELEKRFNT